MDILGTWMQHTNNSSSSTSTPSPLSIMLSIIYKQDCTICDPPSWTSPPAGWPNVCVCGRGRHDITPAPFIVKQSWEFQQMSLSFYLLPSHDYNLTASPVFAVPVSQLHRAIIHMGCICLIGHMSLKHAHTFFKNNFAGVLNVCELNLSGLGAIC